MSTNLEAKKVVVDEIKNKIAAAKSIVFVDYTGITVEKDTALRKLFRESKVFYKVYKNRLMIKALQEAGYTGFETSQFDGATAVAFAEDELTALSIIFKALKEKSLKEVKLGFINGVVASKEDLEKLSKIPSKATLIAMLLSMLNAPTSSLVRALNEITKK